jgi:hypothetical protein
MPISKNYLIAVAACLLTTTGHAVAQPQKSDVSCQDECRLACCQSPTSPYWVLSRSENFIVCAPASYDGRAAACACETQLNALAKKWSSNSELKWSKPCYVVFHPTVETYTQAAGRGSAQTAGCSTVQQVQGRILSRRIDLRLDRPNPLVDALPHELTHVVLAELLADGKLPRWADEGMAMLADPHEKQRLHTRDLHHAFADGSAFRLADLLVMDGYPAHGRQAAFYAQSLSLVSFLVELKSPRVFLEFTKAGAATGYNTALQKCYGIDNAWELERMWMAHAAPQMAYRATGATFPGIRRETAVVSP